MKRTKSQNFRCSWGPLGKWLKAHGDNKSTTNETFETRTMASSDERYLVKVIRRSYGTVLGLFEVPEPHSPISGSVVAELLKRVKTCDNVVTGTS